MGASSCAIWKFVPPQVKFNRAIMVCTNGSKFSGFFILKAEFFRLYEGQYKPLYTTNSNSPWVPVFIPIRVKQEKMKIQHPLTTAWWNASIIRSFFQQPSAVMVKNTPQLYQKPLSLALERTVQTPTKSAIPNSNLVYPSFSAIWCPRVRFNTAKEGEACGLWDFWRR